MKFWSEHVALRVALIAVLFIVGMISMLRGILIPGKLIGLGMMLAGLALLLAALWLYNQPFTEPKKPKN